MPTQNNSDAEKMVILQELHNVEVAIQTAEDELALLLEQRRAIINRYNLNKGKTCD